MGRRKSAVGGGVGIRRAFRERGGADGELEAVAWYADNSGGKGRLRLRTKGQMRGACTTCWETCGNGRLGSTRLPDKMTDRTCRACGAVIEFLKTLRVPPAQ
jgi:hypothetical protein